jgi:uncharacterized protein YlxP (DUF503 family)
MFVGVLRLSLSIVGARSLKDKRSVVRSFKDRMQSKYRVSIAEVGALDVPKHAVLGVAVVSNSATLCDQILADVASAASTLSHAVLDDRALEILPFGESGRGVRGGIEHALDRDPQGVGGLDDDELGPYDSPDEREGDERW